MAEKQSGSGVPVNLTTIMALLTCVGGLWMASKSVNSDRPNSPAETHFQTIGEQTVDARLWEDPLDWDTNQSRAYGSKAFALLRRQIAEHSTGDCRPILLPVFTDGGSYSEDRESRLRSRYAVISALGESGYVPEDEDHIGTIDIPWRNTLEFGACLNDVSLWRPSCTNWPCSHDLRIAFEWYRSRVFDYGSKPPPDQKLLVLWLNEDEFDDHPQARLARLFHELVYTNLGTNFSCSEDTLTNLFAGVDLIGPRTSTTLRAMLPPYGQTGYAQNKDVPTNCPATNCPATNDTACTCDQLIKNLLRPIDVYCPTPSAMDAVLVTNSTGPPRKQVGDLLTNWFHSFHNFAATDSQLAGEALDELKLRQIDLSHTNRNLVLISQWDTFYGRALSLTYAAELARFQTNASNDNDFVAAYLDGRLSAPPNFHCYVYLRGLDGQTSRKLYSGSSSNRPASLQALIAGDPNESKAEGLAQFDYMNRLGGRLKELEAQLKRESGGRIDALGICGNDPYDTLVILQVLRPLFPNAVFFTTDLDARFAHPKEQAWARNLIVLSSYGLELEKKLQGSVAPFRDSQQTAQFAATLAALGNPRLQNLPVIPPRRFEIGRDQAFDLSIADGLFLQPPPAVGYSRWGTGWLTGLLLAGSGAVLLFYSWRRIQRLTVDATQYEIKGLWFGPEDVGGKAGAERLTNRLMELSREGGDPLVRWLCGLCPGHSRPEVFGQKDLQAFLDFLNQVALQNSPPRESVFGSAYITSPVKEELLQLAREKQGEGTFLARNSVHQMRFNRKILGELFGNIVKPAPADQPAQKEEWEELARATISARLAGEQQYLLRRRQRISFYIGGIVLFAVVWLLLRAALSGSVPRSGGEPFLFFSGISLWPTTLLRLLAVVLAVIFLARAYSSLRSAIFTLSRRFRLPLTEKSAGFSVWRLPSTPPPQATVDAETLWEYYQQLGRFWQRAMRVSIPFTLYIIFCFSLNSWIGDSPYTPARGMAASLWCGGILMTAVFISIFLAFWIIDAACLCRWLIERFSQSPTRYPRACLRYFASQHGLADLSSHSGQNASPETREAENNVDVILAEWIDMQLIAELTARVGQLIYFPFIVFFVMILSRNNIFDRWPWVPILIIIFALNLTLCVASMVILRNAALKARDAGLENLRSRVEAAEQKAAVDPQTNRAHMGRRLLDELESLDKGAFAPLWENPLIGAILIPSGGSVLIEVLSYLFH